MSEANRRTVAFLGPIGTYSHQAAHAVFGNTVSYTAQQTIADAIDSIEKDCDLAVVPQENSTFGHVVETYDLLREPRVGQHLFARGEGTISIQHCLLVQKGVRLEDIDLVMSHEQALGQCRKFLARRLPNAALKKTTSTAAAAEAVLAESEPDDPYRYKAALCSKICLSLFQGLEMLEEGVQDEQDNFTRFYVISNSLDAPLPGTTVKEDGAPARALLRIHPAKKGDNITSMLLALELYVTRMDRRPSLIHNPFEDVYFIEVEQQVVERVLEDVATWREEVQAAVDRAKGMGYACELIGLWQSFR